MAIQVFELLPTAYAQTNVLVYVFVTRGEKMAKRDCTWHSCIWVACHALMCKLLISRTWCSPRLAYFLLLLACPLRVLLQQNNRSAQLFQAKWGKNSHPNKLHVCGCWSSTCEYIYMYIHVSSVQSMNLRYLEEPLNCRPIDMLDKARSPQGSTWTYTTN